MRIENTETGYPLNLLQYVFRDPNVEQKLVRDYDLVVEGALRTLEEQCPFGVQAVRLHFEKGSPLTEVGDEICEDAMVVYQEYFYVLHALRSKKYADYLFNSLAFIMQRLEYETSKMAYESARADIIAEVDEIRKTANEDIGLSALSKILPVRTIDEMDLSVRAYNCLARANIRYSNKIAKMTYDDLARIRNMGPKIIAEIASKMRDLGYDTTAMEPPTQK